MTKKTHDNEKIPEELRPLIQLVAQGMEGNQEALPALRALLTQTPQLLNPVSELAHQVEKGLLNYVSNNNPEVKEALAHQLTAMQSELAGPVPSAVEKLLAEEITICWLQARHADAVDARHYSTPTDHALKRQDRAHRRLLSSIKMLAQLRKMFTPVTQINIADQQVNVGEWSASAQDPSVKQ